MKKIAVLFSIISVSSLLYCQQPKRVGLDIDNQTDFEIRIQPVGEKKAFYSIGTILNVAPKQRVQYELAPQQKIKYSVDENSILLIDGQTKTEYVMPTITKVGPAEKGITPMIIKALPIKKGGLNQLSIEFGNPK